MRKMLSFSVKSRLIIEALLSAFLLFDFVYLLIGVINKTQTHTGNIMMLLCTIAFGVGGMIAAIRTILRAKRYLKEKRED